VSRRGGAPVCSTVPVPVLVVVPVPVPVPVLVLVVVLVLVLVPVLVSVLARSPTMTASPLQIRPASPDDLAQWRPLWDGYNAFYGRSGTTALPEHITATTWQRFFDPAEPMGCLVAEQDGKLLGLTHYLFHRSMIKIEPVCYLSDLFTDPAHRGGGVGRALIEGVYAAARAAGSTRVYWQTHTTNAAGRLLYDTLASHLGYVIYSRDLL
jgi:GNAT superfamily N-acetyltransferase